MQNTVSSRKILIIGPSWVGDTIMAQALFQLIKQQTPDAVLHVMAPEWTFSVFACMPEISKVIPMPLTHGEFKLLTRYRLGRALRAEQYDQAIVLPNSFKSALIPWFACIPKRTGWLRECRSLLLNDGRTLDKKQTPLMVEQYLSLGLPKNTPLTKPYPLPRLKVESAAQLAALAKIGVVMNDKPILALGAGAEFGPSKRWPESYFAEVAKQKLSEGWNVWLFGSPKDRHITEAVNALVGDACVNIAGRTELSETLALLSLVQGAVTNDSGLMHMAAALGKPLVAVYGSTSPAFTPPLSKDATVLQLQLPCQPCFQRQCPLKHHLCMLDLKPVQVLAAMRAWH
jgi:heptosyltransferase-2